jgi:hypothetical protein
MIRRLAVLGALAASMAALPLAAWAQAKSQAHTFRCTGKDGKKYYGSTIPQACLGLPIEALSSQGTVLYRVDAEADERARKAKEADAAKKREEDAANKEEARRNRALLATYTSEKDVEDARARALADNAKSVKEVETRMEAIRKRQAGYAKEMEFYSDGRGDKGGKPAKSGAKPPPKLVEDMRTAEVDLKLQQDALEQRKKQVELINAKYNEDKKRFLALTKGR